MAEPWSVCPLLLPQDPHCQLFDGYISVQGAEYRLRLTLPGEDRPLHQARLECDWELRQCLRGCEPVIQQRLAQSPTVASFLTELTSLLHRLVETQQGLSGRPLAPRFFTSVVEEIESLGWERLSYVDPSFSALQLTARDSQQRQHTVTVLLNEKYPAIAPACTVDLPVALELHWPTQGGSLQVVYKQFCQALDVFGDFWDVMDELDKNTWVLEPEQPNRSATTRRIAIGNSSSVQIEVDPRHPRMLPDIQLLGAEHVTSALREHLGKNIHEWNASLSLLSNLQTVLGLKFPTKANSKKEDFSMECGICYAYRLNGDTPTLACNDARCHRPFHHLCLYEWLRSVPSCRQSFNVIFGECPYCSQPITVKMPGLG